MGRRGPPPEPTKLRVIKGNPGKRALNQNEPQPESGIPDCPDFITGRAAEEWDRIAVQLDDVGLLSKIDRAALAAYCTAYERWSKAEETVRKSGTLIKSPNGFPMISPAVSVATKAMDQMLKIAKEFGMTPSSRSSIAVDKKAAESDPSEAFFASNGKK